MVTKCFDLDVDLSQWKTLPHFLHSCIKWVIKVSHTSSIIARRVCIALKESLWENFLRQEVQPIIWSLTIYLPFFCVSIEFAWYVFPGREKEIWQTDSQVLFVIRAISRAENKSWWIFALRGEAHDKNVAMLYICIDFLSGYVTGWQYSGIWEKAVLQGFYGICPNSARSAREEEVWICWNSESSLMSFRFQAEGMSLGTIADCEFSFLFSCWVSCTAG